MLEKMMMLPGAGEGEGKSSHLVSHNTSDSARGGFAAR
jgi:hypothetical protein